MKPWTAFRKAETPLLSTKKRIEYTSHGLETLRSNAENEIETLVKAKGFADCLAFRSQVTDLTVMTWVMLWRKPQVVEK